MLISGDFGEMMYRVKQKLYGLFFCLGCLARTSSLF